MSDNDSIMEAIRERLTLGRLAMLGKLSALVAHEFNNILTPLAGYSELALYGKTEEKDEALRMTMTSTERAGKLVQALMAAGGRDTSGPQPNDPVELVNNATFLLSKLTGKKNVEVMVEWKELWPATFDFSLMSLALLNILWTILSYLPDGGRIRIDGESSEKKGMKLTISDNAAALDEETRWSLIQAWVVPGRPVPGKPGQFEDAIGLRFAGAAAMVHGGSFDLVSDRAGNRYVLSLQGEG
ncbi:MAG TPA: histidine kinase dimerization/phospho-acceptor domain-containing protein [Candidatus Brocadiia bacterium]|nr:histidine kinase dimerization/phospho-acceptor domain-containing protein [Candidatus Brocadiia bacterium]